ncbi:MAG: SAM-dependent methyltransferase [Lachnospiraceae bacterium]|nr:SAM-dependent methyltransferase [Lachnospiraceae bacterium]
MHHLSKRLSSVVSYVSSGNKVADIGCDHAFTSIHLIRSGIASSVLASDVNDGPLVIAEKNIRMSGLDSQIEVRKSNGLSEITTSDNIDTILISGMGGYLIIDILNSNIGVRDKAKELILQPQSDIHNVRHYLHNNGFSISDEMMVYEDGKYYNIIKAVPGNQSYDNEFEYLYGKALIDNRDEVFKDYIKNIYKTNAAIISRLEGNEKQTDRLCEFKKENEYIEHLLEKIM